MILPILLAAVSTAFATPPGFTLPNDVVPRNYAIELTIDPSRADFEGRARIEMDVRAPQSVIWINGKDLTILDASLNGKPVKATPVGGEFIEFELDHPAKPGAATLNVHYRAPLSDTAVSGPYRREVDGNWYAFTVFTPIDARRAFPCFDEPHFKAHWQMSIRVKQGDKAFANAPSVGETEETGGTKLIRFAPTQLMASEVVAFVVGPFDVWDGGKAGEKQIPVRVITPKGHAIDGKQAALATATVIPRLEKYTGVAYPWEKLDHVALPAGAFGAVENPGLITYQSRGLLVAPGEEAPDRLRGIRSLESHEIGHQWFGNLVTQATWDDVWLSEGFATWIAAKMMDEEQPPQRQHLTSVAARERIMTTDASDRTRPVRLTMHNRDDTKGVYNQMVYQKGAAILLMLEGWLGEGAVQKGLHAYLEAHKLNNATTADLEAALRGAAGTDPAPVMNSFLDHSGVPAIRAELHCQPGGAAQATIERTSEQTQAIPVCWRDPTGKACAVLDTPKREIALKSGCPAWIDWNAGGTGYYRSEWTAAQLSSLAANGVAQFTPAEKLTLIYDVKAEHKAGKLDDAAIRPVLNPLTSDSEPEVAQAAKVALGLEAEPEPRRRKGN